jgi:hypothetical protein
MTFTRFGIYYTPPEGAFRDAGAIWLGWDLSNGIAVGNPDHAITARPRKYGFHATLKPPFRLTDGYEQKDLEEAVIRLCGDLEPVSIEELVVSRLGSFLALTPTGDVSPLKNLAARIVTDLDAFRAAAGKEELAKRRNARLTPSQRSNLEQWGYAHVMQDFRFHMTLSGPLSIEQLALVEAQARSHFATVTPRPLRIDALSLVGEVDGGAFKEVARFALNRQSFKGF